MRRSVFLITFTPTQASVGVGLANVQLLDPFVDRETETVIWPKVPPTPFIYIRCYKPEWNSCGLYVECFIRNWCDLNFTRFGSLYMGYVLRIFNYCILQYILTYSLKDFIIQLVQKVSFNSFCAGLWPKVSTIESIYKVLQTWMKHLHRFTLQVLPSTFLCRG